MFRHRITSCLLAGVLVALPMTVWSARGVGNTARDCSYKGPERRQVPRDHRQAAAWELKRHGFINKNEVNRFARVFATLERHKALRRDQIKHIGMIEQQRARNLHPDGFAHLPRKQADSPATLMTGRTGRAVLGALEFVAMGLDTVKLTKSGPVIEGKNGSALVRATKKVHGQLVKLPWVDANANMPKVLPRGESQKYVERDAFAIPDHPDTFQGAAGLYEVLQRDVVKTVYREFVYDPPPRVGR